MILLCDSLTSRDSCPYGLAVAQPIEASRKVFQLASVCWPCQLIAFEDVPLEEEEVQEGRERVKETCAIWICRDKLCD